MTTTAELSSSQVFDPELYGNGDPTTYGLPLDLYDHMREHEPVVKIQMNHPLLLPEIWVVSRHADIWAIDKDDATFAANRVHPLVWAFASMDPDTKPGLLVQDGPKHRQQRAIVSGAFRAAVVKRLEARFRAYAKEIVDEALEKRDCDFVTDIAHPMPVRALGDIMGIPEADREMFFGWVDTFASPFDTRVTPSLDNVIAAMAQLWEYGLKLIEDKRRAPSDDVMSKIAEMDLVEDEIQGNVALFASGAAETTRGALAHGMHELMRNDEQMAWLRARAGNIPDTAPQEFVRVANSIVSLVRVPTRDVELHGVTIPEGERIAMLFAAGNFDPNAFEDPRRFDLSRHPNLHLGFGRGPHTCIGRHMAALEIKILMQELLQRTKAIDPAGPIDYVKDNYTRGVYSLPVTITPA